MKFFIEFDIPAAPIEDQGFHRANFIVGILVGLCQLLRRHDFQMCLMGEHKGERPVYGADNEPCGKWGIRA